jgi:hypothetical protein
MSVRQGIIMQKKLIRQSKEETSGLLESAQSIGISFVIPAKAGI